jgi:hypothetical protein
VEGGGGRWAARTFFFFGAGGGGAFLAFTGGGTFDILEATTEKPFPPPQRGCGTHSQTGEQTHSASVQRSVRWLCRVNQLGHDSFHSHHLFPAVQF